MTEHFNRLTPAEAERLALVAEECGEVLQAIGKVLRHGYASTHPDGGPTNREALEREIGDLSAVCDLLAQDDLDPRHIVRAARNKRENMQKYLHHQAPVEP